MKYELQRKVLISKKVLHCAMFWLILLIRFAFGKHADVANLPDDDFLKLWTQSQIFIYQCQSSPHWFKKSNTLTTFQNEISHQKILIGFGNLLTAKHVLTATSIFMKSEYFDGDFLKPDVKGAWTTLQTLDNWNIFSNYKMKIVKGIELNKNWGDNVQK